MGAVKKSVVFLNKSLFGVRFKSTNAVKLVYSDYGDPTNVVRLEKEIIEPPGTGKVRKFNNFFKTSQRFFKTNS